MLNRQALATDIADHETDLSAIRGLEKGIMAEAPGYSFVVTKSPDREERYRIVEERAKERIQDLEEVTQEFDEYRKQENAIVEVMEEAKGIVGEKESYGIDLGKMKADFGRINVSVAFSSKLVTH